MVLKYFVNVENKLLDLLELLSISESGCDCILPSCSYELPDSHPLLEKVSTSTSES